MTTELDARILIRIPMATLVTSQTWIDTIVDYVSNEIEVWGRMQGSKEARKNGDIEALADAMRALKNSKIKAQENNKVRQTSSVWENDKCISWILFHFIVKTKKNTNQESEIVSYLLRWDLESYPFRS